MPTTATKPKTLTQAQRDMLLKIYRAQPDSGTSVWYRAATHGERVTLASLYYRNLLMRRAWSKAGTSSPAHEYCLQPQLYAAIAARGTR